jgi:hypothetical protein
MLPTVFLSKVIWAFISTRKYDSQPLLCVQIRTDTSSLSHRLESVTSLLIHWAAAKVGLLNREEREYRVRDAAERSRKLRISSARL